MWRLARSFRIPGFAVALVALLAVGCGSDTTTVTGNVTYQGKPVSNGSVVFYCYDKQIARGIIGADGQYSIPNVPLGAAVVTVQTHPKVPAGLKLKQTLPAAQFGAPIHPVIESSNTMKMLIPARYSHPEESGLCVVIDRGLVTHDIDLKP